MKVSSMRLDISVIPILDPKRILPSLTKGCERDQQESRPVTIMRPLVSILIPAYNVEEWIVDTLLSAIAQTWESKEIIVVDDGSTDRTLALAQRFESFLRVA